MQHNYFRFQHEDHPLEAPHPEAHHQDEEEEAVQPAALPPMVPPPALPPVVAEDPPQEAQEEVSPPAPPQAEAPLPEVPPPAEAEAEAHHHGVGHQAQAQARWSPVVAPPPEALLPGKLGVQLPGVSPPGPPLWADPPAVALRAIVQAAVPSAGSAAKFGKLVVKVVKGVDLKAGQGMFGKADPYVKLRIGSQEHATKPHAQGGKNPVWNQEFDFEISTEKDLEMDVMDKEQVGNDKFMGRAKVGIMDWIALGHFEGEISILDKAEKEVGKINVNVKFERPGANAMAAVNTNGNGQQQQNNNVSAGAMVAAAPTQIEPPRDPSGKFTDQEIWEAFQAFDLDKNNFVGAAEIRHVLINIGEQVTDEEVDEMIRMVDKDGDGQVGFEEFFEMSIAPPTGQSVVQQRNAKKQALDEFSRDNNIKPESIKKAYKRFQATDKDKSGMIDYTEFCEVLQIDPSPQCEKVFQMYDYDKSGQIDVREFMIGLANFTGAGKDDKLKFAFMIFDEEGNGVITKGELTKILKANHMAQTEAEVARKAETIMAQADKDGDGVVTFDEFVIVSKKFPNIFPCARC
ncbi:hypothetical protein ScalyP_jg8067 [Parmales sp. scaly parma]|nr:hypothetical protein ScalyP_jg8067 [Parmales sp. scaly parma]